MKRDLVTIKNDKLTVQIDPLGASLTSISETIAGSGERIEYLWQGDSKYWTDQAPNLFPYIARLTQGKYRLDGNEYRMDIHGFAKDLVFVVAKKREDAVEFILEDNEDTYRQYPYHFVLKIGYQLTGRQLKITFFVKNRDEKPMYFGIGGHPGFNVPLERSLRFEDYVLEFSDRCRAKRVSFSPDCFVEGEPSAFALKEDRILPLSHDLFDEDAIVLTEMGKQVTLKAKSGRRKVRVTYNDMDYLGIWHMPHTDAPYVCIEPWSSLPSRKGIVEDLAEQPGLVRLEDNGEYINTWSIEI